MRLKAVLRRAGGSTCVLVVIGAMTVAAGTTGGLILGVKTAPLFRSYLAGQQFVSNLVTSIPPTMIDRDSMTQACSKYVSNGIAAMEGYTDGSAFQLGCSDAIDQAGG